MQLVVPFVSQVIYNGAKEKIHTVATIVTIVGIVANEPQDLGRDPFISYEIYLLKE